MKRFKTMDWGTFILAVVALFSVVIPLIFFPQASENIILNLNNIVTGKLGTLYLGMGLAVLIFVLYISFGKYGHVTLGNASEEPEFSTVSWAAMLFCAGIGSSILYWGVIEWAYYIESPPFHLKPRSEEAINYAATYGIFHWGPIA